MQQGLSQRHTIATAVKIAPLQSAGELICNDDFVDNAITSSAKLADAIWFGDAVNKHIAGECLDPTWQKGDPTWRNPASLFLQVGLAMYLGDI